MPDNRFDFNERCKDLLIRYSRRNAQVVAERLKALCGFLKQDSNHVVQTMFGGSVRKNTYVIGLQRMSRPADLNESSLVNQSPAKVKKHVRTPSIGGFPTIPRGWAT